MKTSLRWALYPTSLVATILMYSTVAPLAGEIQAKAREKRPITPAVRTNAPPAAPDLTKSVFNIPAAPEDGKDPFFPNSTRLFRTVVIAPTNKPAVVAVELHLKGISGSTDRPLAIIDNRSFEVGEEAEVPTRNGRVRVRCVEINQDSVVVQMGTERRVLHLRTGL